MKKAGTPISGRITREDPLGVIFAGGLVQIRRNQTPSRTRSGTPGQRRGSHELAYPTNACAEGCPEPSCTRGQSADSRARDGACLSSGGERGTESVRSPVERTSRRRVCCSSRKARTEGCQGERRSWGAEIGELGEGRR